MELSKCHKAPVKVAGTGDFHDNDHVATMHYVCTECNEPCDLATNPIDSLLDNDKGGIMHCCKEAMTVEEAKQALYAAILSKKPEKQSRTIVDGEGDLVYGHESKWDKGYNQGVEDFVANIKALFDIQLGSSQDASTPKAVGHEADNSSEVVE